MLHDPPCPHAVYCGCPVTWGGGYLCRDTHGLWLVTISQHWPLIGSKVLIPFPVNQFAWTVSGQDRIAYNSPERVWEFVRRHLTKYIICHHFDYFLHLIDIFRNLYLCVFKSLKVIIFWVYWRSFELIRVLMFPLFNAILLGCRFRFTWFPWNQYQYYQ